MPASRPNASHQAKLASARKHADSRGLAQSAGGLTIWHSISFSIGRRFASRAFAASLPSHWLLRILPTFFRFRLHLRPSPSLLRHRQLHQWPVQPPTREPSRPYSRRLEERDGIDSTKDFYELHACFHYGIGSMTKGTCYRHMRQPNLYAEDA